MEEKKETKGKLTYDQLKDVAGKLHQENQRLRNMLMEYNYTNAFKRLDYLFKILEFASYFDGDFVISCSDEIKSIMSIKKNNEETE